MIGNALMMIPFLVGCAVAPGPAGEGAEGADAPAAPDTVTIVRGSHTDAAGTRAWRLVLPAGAGAGAGGAEAGAPRPLLVLLHGCTQDADDVARGTRMDALATARGVAVLYPEQAPDAHPLRCWNWYEPAHQGRDAGEPAILAGMIRGVVEAHGLDPDRVFVAGMSAGGAMAAILAATYPELFAGMASHSGVPFGIARGLPAATAALSGTLEVDPDAAAEAVRSAMGDRARDIPTLIIHGSEDAVVSPRNAAWFEAQGVQLLPANLLRVVMVPGLGHAWSGGAPEGTYTDPRGPDASRMILDFFLDSEGSGHR
ncbi:MAG: esterase [Gemmatimonadales bacterium]|nr:MAG: esterase [Gemmatimonadales bacterium]